MIRVRRLTRVIAAAVTARLGLAGNRSGQKFPPDRFPLSRIVRVVVAFPAGGPTDFVARGLGRQAQINPPARALWALKMSPAQMARVGAEYVARGKFPGWSPPLSDHRRRSGRDAAPVAAWTTIPSRTLLRGTLVSEEHDHSDRNHAERPPGTAWC